MVIIISSSRSWVPLVGTPYKRLEQNTTFGSFSNCLGKSIKIYKYISMGTKVLKILLNSNRIILKIHGMNTLTPHLVYTSSKESLFQYNKCFLAIKKVND